MKLIVHAGFHKTGSSSFQHACATSRDSLRRHGVCYPQLPGSLYEPQHADIALALFNNNLQAVDTLLDSAVSQASAQDVSVVLLSSEEFDNLGKDPSLYYRFDSACRSRFDSVEYVVLARNIRPLFKSHISQAITHFGFDLWSSGYAKSVVRHIVASQAALKRLLGEHLRIYSFESAVKAPSFCNKLLTLCVPHITKEAEILSEWSINRSDSAKHDLYYLFGGLVRAAIAKDQGINPYSTTVNAELQRLLPPDMMRNLGASIDIPRIGELVEHMIEQIVSNSLDPIMDSFSREYRESIDPDLAAALFGA